MEFHSAKVVCLSSTVCQWKYVVYFSCLNILVLVYSLLEVSYARCCERPPDTQASATIPFNVDRYSNIAPIVCFRTKSSDVNLSSSPTTYENQFSFRIPLSKGDRTVWRGKPHAHSLNLHCTLAGTRTCDVQCIPASQYVTRVGEFPLQNYSAMCPCSSTF